MAIMKLIKELVVVSLIVLLIACSSETESTSVSIQPSPDIKTTVHDNIQKSLTTNPTYQMGTVVYQYKLKSPWDTRIFNNDAPGSKCSNPIGLPIHIPNRLKNGEVDQKAWDAFTNVDNILQYTIGHAVGRCLHVHRKYTHEACLVGPDTYQGHSS